MDAHRRDTCADGGRFQVIVFKLKERRVFRIGSGATNARRTGGGMTVSPGFCGEEKAGWAQTAIDRQIARSCSHRSENFILSVWGIA